MLKQFSELLKIDVTPFCEKRDGNEYLPWAKCYELLYQNGAERVYHEPLVNERTGSTLFMTDIPFGDPGKENRCYEVRVKITIDNDVFVFNHPLMNGTNPVRDNSMSQLRLSNAQQRAFVKGVAVRTGLGFNLWIKDDSDLPEDLSRHSITAIKRRVEQLITAKIQSGMSQTDIVHALNMNDRSFQSCLEMYSKLDAFEKALSRI